MLLFDQKFTTKVMVMKDEKNPITSDWSWYLLLGHFMLHLFPQTSDQKPEHRDLPQVGALWKYFIFKKQACIAQLKLIKK